MHKFAIFIHFIIIFCPRIGIIADASSHSHLTEFTFILRDRDRVCFSEEFHTDDLTNYTFTYHAIRGDAQFMASGESLINTNIYRFN